MKRTPGPGLAGCPASQLQRNCIAASARAQRAQQGPCHSALHGTPSVRPFPSPLCSGKKELTRCSAASSAVISSLPSAPPPAARARRRRSCCAARLGGLNVVSTWQRGGRVGMYLKGRAQGHACLALSSRGAASSKHQPS